MVPWRRSVVGVLVTLSLLANSAGPALAETPSPPRRPIEDAIDLMYAAQGILLAEDEEVDAVEAPATSLVGLSRVPQAAENPAEQILVRLINATKEQIRDTKTACRSAERTLQTEGKECALQVLSNDCAEQQARLEARLALLRKLRGDRRKALTKAWASVRRSARSVWHRLGPTGRSFFRAFGKDVVQTVVTGGTLGGGVLRTLFLARARSMARQKMRDAAGRLAERVLVGNVKASAAGGDPCREESQAEESAQATPKSGLPSWLNQVPVDEFAADDGCEGEAWLDEAWPEVEAQLAAEKKACQEYWILQYRDCLEKQEAEGACAVDAALACADLYSVIPPDVLSVSGAVGDHYAPPDRLTFSYDAGGSASGTFHQEIDWACLYVTDISFTGTFDYATCSFKGTGQYSWKALQTEDTACVIEEGGEDEIGVPITWEATLENGLVSGQIMGPHHGYGIHIPVGEQPQ